MEDRKLRMLYDEISHASSLDFFHHHMHQNHNITTQGSGLLGTSGKNHCLRCMHDDDPVSRYMCRCTSPASGFSLQSAGSSSSLNSPAQTSSERGSPALSPMEEHKSDMPFGYLSNPNRFCLESSFPAVNEATGDLFDQQSLSEQLSKMYVTDGQHTYSPSSREFSPDPYGFLYPDNRISFGNFSYDLPNFGVVPSPIPKLQCDYKGGDSSCSQDCLINSDSFYCASNLYNGSMNSTWQNAKDALLYSRGNRMDLIEERNLINPRNVSQLNADSRLQHGLALSSERTRAPSNIRIPQIAAFNSEDSFIIQGEALKYVIKEEVGHTREESKSSCRGVNNSKTLERRPQERQYFSAPSNPLRYNYLREVQGYIHLIAKDQHGCRFLQRVFNEGTPQDVAMIFNEVIHHVIELMMNPFGNYLMQKLLDVCNEEQRMQILHMVTVKPGTLTRISLNTHGTRVVQKLIDTLKTRQQISLVISALQPGFLDLIKDINGNHVVSRCLQCFDVEDNKFIFIAAAKYCVDIATHRQGCVVLQKCISHSTGVYQHNIIREICDNGVLLAQDPFGNYAVQYILNGQFPWGASRLIPQFEGNYAHFSTQKFASHVVERCLNALTEEKRSDIIHELIAAPIERLMHDQVGNYVVQTALRVSEGGGDIHNKLVAAIKVHKASADSTEGAKNIFKLKYFKR